MRDLIRPVGLALGVRLIHNLWLHPPGAYVTSDMKGYADRALRLSQDFWALPQASSFATAFPRTPYDTFFPYGTHVLLAFWQVLFGVRGHVPAAILLALLGAATVGLVVRIAERLGAAPRVARFAGYVAALWYPSVALGGYLLSETPAALALAAIAFLSLRLADEGRDADAWHLGLAFALGAAVRPQILAALPGLALVAVWRRAEWPRLRLRHVVGVAVPIAALLAVSAARVRYHTGEAMALVSTNGPMNRAFGRCHAVGIRSVGKNGETRGQFGPPPFGVLHRRAEKDPTAWIGLDPALEPSLEVRGPLFDAERLDALSARCVEATGWARQAGYAAVHVALLWGALHTTWPDAANGFRWPMRVAMGIVAIALLPATLGALWHARRREGARVALVLVHLVALVGVVVLYFGDSRFRVPYDPVLIAAGVTVTAAAAARPRWRSRFEALRARWRRRRWSAPPSARPAR